MPSTISAEALGRVVLDVLQDAAFLFAERAESTARDEDGPVVTAALTFNGASSGRLLFSCSRSLAIELAANLLGIDPDEEEATAKCDDAVGEMLNILAGAVLASWFGIDGQFEMGVPVVEELSEESYGRRTEEARLVLPLITDEGHRIDVAVMA